MKTQEVDRSLLDAQLSTKAGERLSRGARVKIIDNQAIAISGSVPRIARVRDEPFECIIAPDEFVEKLKNAGVAADLFTFMQELSERAPKFDYHLEWDSQALLPLTTYDDWWKKQIDGKSRNMVRKAQKGGVEVRLVEFDDTFVKDIAEIYNETPVRQGKRFVHYGKDLDTLKRDHATFLGRSAFIAAFFKSELIGFAKFVRGRNVASLMQILCKTKDRDKAPSNALVAKAVELCVDEAIPYLHYGVWSTGGLGMFKTSLGFIRHDVPRYYVPLNAWGRVLLTANMHHRWSDLVPNEWREHLAPLRRQWNTLRYGRANSAVR